MLTKRLRGRRKGDVGWVAKILVVAAAFTIAIVLAITGQHRILFGALDKALKILDPTQLWAMVS